MEAEWENACRAGANTKFFWGDDEGKLGDYAWYRENMGGQMHAVGQKKPNAWGLYDINGLMWEYCRISDAPPGPDAKESFKDFITRGATWGSRPPMFVLGVRMPVGEDKPGPGSDRFGMRVVVDLK
jgi:formylglycine-generating enzyme required for sulfatase activity